MSEWKTIDTAPKDGKDFLVYDGENIGIVYWSKDNSIVCSYFFCEVDNIFTHWMPMPNPPETDL